MEGLYCAINSVFPLDLGHQAGFWGVWAGERVRHPDSWRCWEGGGHQIRFVCVSIPFRFSSQHAVMWEYVVWFTLISALPEDAGGSRSAFIWGLTKEHILSVWTVFTNLLNVCSWQKIKWKWQSKRQKWGSMRSSAQASLWVPSLPSPVWTGVFGTVVFWDNAICLLGTIMLYKTTRSKRPRLQNKEARVPRGSGHSAGTLPKAPAWAWSFSLSNPSRSPL